MKNKIFAGILTVAGLILIQPQAPVAAVVTENIRSLKLPANLNDTALSADGQLFFVLSNRRQVDIYSEDGNLKDSVTLTEAADRLDSSPTGDVIFLTDTEKGMSQIVSMSFIQEIETKDSPFKGPADARVTIAIFSDFQ